MTGPKPEVAKVGYCCSGDCGELGANVTVRLRTTCPAFRVNVRLREITGCWIASADTRRDRR